MIRFALLLLVATSALAQSRAITPFLGVQGGGELEIDNEKYTVDTAPAFGVMLSFDRGRGRILDFLYSHQDSEAGPSDVTVDVAQVGGRYLLRTDRRANPYIAATVGATHIGTGVADALRVSFAGGAGVEIRVTPGLAITVDGRLYTTLFGDRAHFECDNTIVCSTNVSGRMFQQFVGSAGLTIRF